MDWTTLALEQGGWGVAVVLAAAIGRAFTRGEMVAGREYERVVAELERVSSRAERLAEHQREEAAEERARLVAQIAELRAERHDRQTTEDRS